MRANLRGILTAVVIVTIAAASGCTGKSAPSPAVAARADFDKAAVKAIAAWPHRQLAQVWNTGFIPLQVFTVVPTMPDMPTDMRQALDAGFFQRLAPWPATPHATDNVTFADGSTMTVPVESAQAAFAEMRTRPTVTPCRSDQETNGPTPCSITITHVAFGTTTIYTSRGMAKVPAWLYTTNQFTQPIARVAIAPSARTSPVISGLPEVNDTLVAAIDGADLSLTLVTGPHETGVRAQVYETATAVVVGWINIDPPTGIVQSMAVEQPVTVTLQAPLGTRVLLDGSGAPLIVGAKYGDRGPNLRF